MGRDFVGRQKALRRCKTADYQVHAKDCCLPGCQSFESLEQGCLGTGASIWRFHRPATRELDVSEVDRNLVDCTEQECREFFPE